MPRGTTCRSQKMPHVAFEAVVQPPYIMDEETGPHKLICFSPILPLPLPPPNLRDQKHKNGRYQVAQRAHSGFSIRCYGKTVPLISIQFSSVAQLCLTFVTPWTAACQASLSITNSRSSPKLMSIDSMMPSNHLIFSCPFSSCIQSFPAPRSFEMSELFTSGGQSIGVSVSTSVLPINTQD